MDDKQAHFTINWIGHSTLLIQIDGLNILTDPIWSKRCSPVSFAGPKRYTAPGIRFEDLPEIHIVLISHNHYDHLDKSTIRRIGNSPLYIVPKGIGDFLRKNNITNYTELKWWESIKHNGVEFIGTPARHVSARTPFDIRKSLCCSFVVNGAKNSLFFTGDTAYSRKFRKIGEIYGPFDLVAVPIGPYLPQWLSKYFHIGPREALQLYQDLNGRKFLAIHWGCFRLGLEGVNAPPRALIKEVKRNKLDPDDFWILKPGETRIVEKGL